MLDNSKVGVLIINRNNLNWFSIIEYYFLLLSNKTARIPLNPKWLSLISIKMHVNQIHHISVEVNAFHYPFPLISIYLKWFHFKWAIATHSLSVFWALWQGHNLAANTCSYTFTSLKPLLDVMIDWSRQPTHLDSCLWTTVTSSPALNLTSETWHLKTDTFPLLKKNRNALHTFPF